MRSSSSVGSICNERSRGFLGLCLGVNVTHAQAQGERWPWGGVVTGTGRHRESIFWG